MRLISITDSLVVGGGGRVMESLTKIAYSYGLKYSIIGFSGDVEYVAILKSKGLDAQLLSKGEMIEFINNDSLIIYHSSGSSKKIDLATLSEIKRKSQPQIMMERSIFGHVDEASDKIFDKVLCNSLNTMWRIKERKLYDFDPSKYELMYNAINVELFTNTISKTDARREMGLPINSFIIGDSCRPALEKTSIMLYRLSMVLVNLFPNLVVVTRKYPELMAVKLSKLLGDKYINLPFEKDIEKTPYFYKSLDVFVHFSTMGESFGMSNAEAMLSEVPVIVNETPGKSNNNAQCEMVQDGVSGYICNSVSSAVDALSLIKDTKPVGIIQNARNQFVNGAFNSSICFGNILNSMGLKPSSDHTTVHTERIENYLKKYTDKYTQPRVVLGRYFFSDVANIISEQLWKIERKLLKGK